MRTPSGLRFAFSAGEGSGWVSAGSLGLDLPDVRSVIAAQREIAAAMRAAEPDVAADAEFACPVVRPGKVMGIGLNYLAHIAEVGKPAPTEPLVFTKATSALNGPYDPIELPGDLTAELDYECELAVVIGTPTRRADRGQALAAVFGYCVANDVSARDLQRRMPQIFLSKSLDTFCPIGPWITTADSVRDPLGLGIRTFVNGEQRQGSSTSDMLFDIADLIVRLSATMTLEPGDVILTGTPAGVASGGKPPVWLRPGDVVRCEIDELGALENVVVDASPGGDTATH